MSKLSTIEDDPLGIMNVCSRAWDPGPNPSVIAACVGPGGAGTRDPLAGEIVPDCTNQLLPGKLPISLTTVQPVNTDSKTPFVIQSARAATAVSSKPAEPQ